MASCDPFRQNHKHFIIDTLLDQYSDISDENLFLSIGKVTSWGVTSGSDIPPSSVDSVEDDTEFWRNMIAAKRINRSDVSLVVRRVDWTPGTVYQPYRDNIDLFDDTNPADFYALVDEERVYICIDNGDGSPSLNPPSHTDSIVRKLADNYRWKFLYQIPESKRKFLTKSRVGAVGYMPIEYVEYLRTNDDRTLQWSAQQSAVPGKIEFAYIDMDATAYWTSTPSCVLPSSANTIVSSVAAGATTVAISSPELGTSSDLYKGMMLSIDAGAGKGQRREIKDYKWQTSYAFVEVDPFVLGLSGLDDANGRQSVFSVLPKVVVDGDGTSYGPSGSNPQIRTADFVVRFGATANTTDSCSSFTPRFISSIEVADGGRNYTYAELSIPKGLTTVVNTPSQYKNLDSYLHAVIPPTGGHGANAPLELGASTMMIVKDYDRSENGKVNTDNDFRQFGIIRNPLLMEKQLRIKFMQAGLTSSFAVGATTSELGGAVGKVLSWDSGYVGITGTSELVLGEIRGGTFAVGGTVGGAFNIYDVTPKTVAGSEARHLLQLTLLPNYGEFDSSGGTYKKRHFVYGIGNPKTNVPQSRSSGEIYSWNPSPGSNLSGFLCLQNPKGTFNLGESLLQTRPYFDGSNGSSGSGRVNATETLVSGLPSAYDLTTTITVDGENFDSGTFQTDIRVKMVQGLTASSGYVVDWTPAAGGTSGSLRLSGVQGPVEVGQSISYTAIGASGLEVITTGTIGSVDHMSELKYRTGEVLYIQNIKPIMRGFEQREEIKLVIEL